MPSYNIHDAKTHFSRLIAQVQAGEEVTIKKAGEPIARIVPIRTGAPRQPGSEKGSLWVAEDFDTALPDTVLDEFEGRT